MADPNSERERELELRDYIAVLRRRKWVIATSTLVIVGAAVTASFLQAPRYRATAELLLQPRASERIFAPTVDPAQRTDRQAQIETEIQIMKSRSVRSAVSEELGRAATVSISSKGVTDVVGISATSSDREEAALVANTYASVYIKARRQQTVDDLLSASSEVQAKISELDGRVAQLDAADPLDPAALAERQAILGQRSAFSQQLSQLQLASNLTQSGGAQLVSRAEAPDAPFEPAPLRNAVAAGVVGLLVGSGLAFLRDHLDDTVRSAVDLEDQTGLTVLGSIPRLSTWRNEEQSIVATLSSPESPTAEAYRSLRTSIQFLRLDKSMRVIQVTSALAGEGKSTTIANLAVALGSIGERVLVVCADLRRPRVHTFFGVDNSVGLSSVILGDVPLSDAVVPAPGTQNVFVLPSGPQPYSPSEFLANARVRDLFKSLADQWDLVLVDGAPIVPVSDGLILASEVDATVLLARQGKASRRALSRALDALRLVNAPLVGAVFNGVGDLAGAESGYYGSYGRPEATDDPSDRPRRTRQDRRRQKRAHVG